MAGAKSGHHLADRRWRAIFDETWRVGNRVKAAATAVLTAAVLAGCGGGSSKTTTVGTTVPATTHPPPATSSPEPTATTGIPPKHHRKKPQPLEDSKSPLKVGGRYTCNGKPLKTLTAAGPVAVKPKVVKPGQSFAVTITDPSAKVAIVSLAGVAPKPIQQNASEQSGKLTATLKMPGYATCGNKLLEVEGDLSAEAYVGVSGG
jgi:hypothetical protein